MNINDHPYVAGFAAATVAYVSYCKYRHIVDKTGSVVCKPLDGPKSPPLYHISGDLMTRMIYKEIYLDRCYFKHGVTLDGVKDPFILDIGGNTGFFSRWCAETFPTSRIHVAEPIPLLQECIEANVKLYSNRVTLHKCGVSNERSSAVFTFIPTTSAGSSMYEGDLLAPMNKYPLTQRVGAMVTDLQHILPEQGWIFRPLGKAVQIPIIGYFLIFGLLLPIALLKKVSEITSGLQSKKIKCELMTIEQMLFEDKGTSATKSPLTPDEVQSIDLLKVDVEAAEWVVLDGISDNLWPKIQQVVVEVTDIIDPKTGEGRIQKIVNLLKAKGFKNIIVDIEEWETHKMLDIKTVFATRK